MRKSEWTEIQDGQEVDDKRIEQVQVYAECPYRVSMQEYHKTGLDVIFYG